jgi:hypothetical protein
MRSVVPLAVLCLGSVANLSRPASGQTPTAPEPRALDAMLLPPVDGRLALWVNQPANFAVIGVAPQGGVDILYRQTALDGVPASGYVYVPRAGAEPDAGYEQIYLVASHDNLDLSGKSIEDVIQHAGIADGYDVDTAARPCFDNRRYFQDRPIVVQEEPCPHLRRGYQITSGHRGFFVVPRRTPPAVHPKPGIRLETGEERVLRWLAAEDQWHAITHHGEPGTELTQALRVNPRFSYASEQMRESGSRESASVSSTNQASHTSSSASASSSHKP